MALSVFYAPRWRALDANGNPMNGAILKFFEAGTSTPLDVYADVDGVTSLGVEVTADAGGLFAEMFMLAQAYKVELYTSADVLVWTADDFFPPQPASAANIDMLATAGVAFTAGEAAYLSDGSGGLNAGQMYKADADLEYGSNSPMVYFAAGAIASGASGLFRSEGVVTGLAGLTPGARYYLSGTAGAITTTPGTYPRVVGQALSTSELAIANNPPIWPDVDARVKATVDGRLTLTTGVPVTIADVTAAGTLYFTPYKGNQIASYTGAHWVVRTFAEMSIAVPAVANQVYDVFYDYNDGTPVLVLTAWTNDTTRATALTTQNGVYVKTGDTQQRYLGTVRTVTASQLNDSAALRHVWNYYNRVARAMKRFETTDNWSYVTATYRQANASTANQLDFVIGVEEDPVECSLQVLAANDTGSTTAGASIGLDSTTTVSAEVQGGVFGLVGAAVPDEGTAFYQGFPGIGRHTLVWLERGSAGGATTWYGDAFSTFSFFSGLRGTLWG